MLRDVLGSQKRSRNAWLVLPKRPRPHTEHDDARWNTSTTYLEDVGVKIEWEPVRVEFYTCGWLQEIIKNTPGPWTCTKPNQGTGPSRPEIHASGHALGQPS